MTSRQPVKCRYCGGSYSRTGILRHEQSHNEFWKDPKNQAETDAEAEVKPEIQEIEEIKVESKQTDYIAICLAWFHDDPLMLAVMASLSQIAQGKGQRMDHIRSASELLNMVIKRDNPNSLLAR